jgi:hypothetical protein
MIPEKKSPTEDIREDNCTIVAYDTSTRLLEIGNLMRSENQEDLDWSRLACRTPWSSQPSDPNVFLLLISPVYRYAEYIPGRSQILALASSTLYLSLEVR